MKKLTRFAAVIAVSALVLSSMPHSSKADELERRKASSINAAGTPSLLSKIGLKTVKDRQILLKAVKNVESVAKLFGLQLEHTPQILSDNNIFIVRVPEAIDYDAIIAKLKNSALVKYAEPNYIKDQHGFGYTHPNDYYYPNQWHLTKIGMPAVWRDVEPKNKSIKVAVVDSGVAKSHPDLNGQLLNGYDTYAEDNDPEDTVGHGTAVSGVIAAKTNNGIGVAGISPFTKIIPVRAADSQNISLADSVAGIYYAIRRGANIINLSYGSYQPSEMEFDAVYEAFRKKIIVVAASGNDKGKLTYPAAYPTVISVGSTGTSDKVSEFSGYGELLDLVAPGENIGTTLRSGEYGPLTGTSFAAPVVSGLAAVILSVAANLNPLEVQYLLEKGAKKLSKSDNGWNTTAGFGRVDAIGTFKTPLPSLKNDSGNSRSKARTLSLNKKYTDKHDYSGDTDWYKLTVTKKMKVRVDVSAVENIDSTIWIDKYKNGKATGEKQFNRSKRSGKETFTYSLTPGKYYFEIYDRNYHWSPKPYSLKITKQ
ncbi:S8 family peptidase [Peribacillus glennii]|uniref:Peptidase S8/S53 domain-containing protein n=1 Tax=Peribacillus glennii TaxID=2303991 RepID=A0A372LJP5_9BACI|nr:S8 family serine peptidase [Peribacillus glennii]RFU66700.1 hypothetical protein D0466_00890 [Peribacillus glennii]